MKSPCASSTTSIASYSLHNLPISSSLAISPSMLNTPSVITILLLLLLLFSQPLLELVVVNDEDDEEDSGDEDGDGDEDASNSLRFATSLCLNTFTLALQSLHASIMLAWFNSSLYIMLCSSASAAIARHAM
ncbi:hypothetical protein HRbin04_00240 [archaeon HR04]|nr:hypothetical protein HRbin04_00240 [archaeon HR04]